MSGILCMWDDVAAPPRTCTPPFPQLTTLGALLPVGALV